MMRNVGRNGPRLCRGCSVWIYSPNSTCSPGSEGSRSVSNGRDSAEQLSTSRTTPTRRRYSRPECKTASLTTLRSGTMFARSTGTRGRAWLTWWRAVSHAKISASPARVKGLKDHALVYGARCGGSFAKFDPESSLWRTSQLCLVGGLAEFSETWPRAGLMRNGIAYPLNSLGLPISESVSGLLPTIGANESKGAGKLRYRGSRHFRGAKMSEGLRSCQADPIYTHPSFAEAAMGFPKDWTVWGMPSSLKSSSGSVGGSRKR